MNDFRYYVPDELEIAQSKVHSDSADAKGNRLEKRFGHPALHAELYTPMVHANMVSLLPQVYHGRLSEEMAGLQEFGNQKLSTTIAPGGLKIAGVEAAQLEYDPVLYQRDRGETDWDTRSIASTDMLHSHTMSSPSLGNGKDDYFHSRDPSTTLAGYDSYMQRGPHHPIDSTSNIELSRMDYNRTTDNLPLLATPPGISEQYGGQSPALSRYPTTETAVSVNYNQPVYPPPPAQTYLSDQYREAPTHRPWTPARQGSYNTEPESENLAGRGARRGGY